MPNSFPSLPQWTSTKFVPRYGMQARISSNGTVRLRQLQTAPKMDIQAVFGLLSQSDRDTLWTFYINNRSLTVYFTAAEDGVQRTMLFAADNPVSFQPMSGGRFTATVNLLEA